MHKILALDGGGVRGAGQAEVLRQADTSRFDTIVGTSIGAALAACVAAGVPVETYSDLFKVYMRRIFSGRWWRRFNVLTTPKYCDDALNSVLKTLLPGRFGDLARPTYIVTANLTRRRAKVFCSLDADDGAWPLWEVIRAAVAAETYFSPWHGFADGGIYANNPAMVAVAAVLGQDKALRLSDLGLCSIGTGTALDTRPIGSTRGWSYIRWAMLLIETMLTGSAISMHEYFVTRLPLGKYTRIQFVSDPEWAFDDPGIIDTLLERWQPTISEGVAVVNNF